MFIPLRVGSSLAFSMGIFQRARIWINSPCLSTHGTLGILNLKFYFRLKWLMHILMPLSEALSSSTTGIMSDICIIWTEFFMCVCVCLPVCVPHRSLTLTLKSLSHIRLCDPMNCSLLGSSVHGIFQARVLQWVAISVMYNSLRLYGL